MIYRIYDIIIRKVSKYKLGEGVLGRAWPARKLIEIAYGLYGDKEKEVRRHELNHIKHPDESEYEIRVLTRIELLSLGITPSFH